VGHKLSQGFLDCVKHNFLIQVLEGPHRHAAELDLLVSSKEELLGEMVIRGSS